MEKIHVLVGWSGKNFGASIDDERIGGVVAVTAKTYGELQVPRVSRHVVVSLIKQFRFL